MIQSKGGEHGKRVIEFWKEQGVDVDGMSGFSDGGYYGLINGYFSVYSLMRVQNANAKIIELPEPTIELKESNQPTHQFEKWHAVFELQSQCRKLGFSELEMLSVLSNRFELKRNSMVQAENCSRNCGHGEEPKQTTNTQSLIGRKVRGFNFEGDIIDYHVGDVGLIIENDGVVCIVEFDDDDETWAYPTSLIHDHLVDECTRDIDTCRNFNEEIGCVQTNCKCEKQEPNPSPQIIDLSNIEGVEMLVSFNEEQWEVSKVVAKFGKCYITKEGSFVHAKPIEVKKVTMQEVEKLFGCKVEIVKEEK